MLMKLLWDFAGPPITALLGLIPEAPEPAEWVIPWPAWIDSWPFTLSVVTIVTAGSAFLLLRLARYVYGLVPVIQ